MLTAMISRWTAPRFTCPLCGFIGRFRSVHQPTGTRRYAECRRCGSAERHRLAWAAARGLVAGRAAMLHVAPERQLSRCFRAIVDRYLTTDLAAPGVDYRADLAALPFGDGEFDVVFASHVLEHIRDDMAAMREVRRVLRRGGVAILPVPVTGERTIEYPGPNLNEHGHIRSPGADYFDRLRQVFSRVDVITSGNVAGEYQTFVYEDRSAWPFETLRPTVAGDRHPEMIPVCHV